MKIINWIIGLMLILAMLSPTAFANFEWKSGEVILERNWDASSTFTIKTGSIPGKYIFQFRRPFHGIQFKMEAQVTEELAKCTEIDAARGVIKHAVYKRTQGQWVDITRNNKKAADLVTIFLDAAVEHLTKFKGKSERV